MNKPVILYGFDDYADISTAEIQHIDFRACEIDKRTTIEEALSRKYFKQWKAAADAEYQSLIIENNTWELVKLPEGRKAMDCKWVF